MIPKKLKEKKVLIRRPPYVHRGPFRQRNQLIWPSVASNLAARLELSGVNTSFSDGNLYPQLRRTELGQKQLMYTLIGYPYVDVVREELQLLRQTGYSEPVFIGGQGISKLKKEHQNLLFSNLGPIIFLDSLEDLIDPPIPDKFSVDVVPWIKRNLSTAEISQYLGYSSLDSVHPFNFPLFIADGCPQRCDFCSANKGMAQQWRNEEALRSEVEYISEQTSVRQMPGLEVYLSTLDGFLPGRQDGKIKYIHDILEEIRDSKQPEEVDFQMQMLASTHMAARYVKNFGLEKIRSLKHLGLQLVGFGVDGGSEETWEGITKKQTKDDVYRAFDALTSCGINTQALIVMGFPPKNLGEGKIKYLYRHWKKQESDIAIADDLIRRFGKDTVEVRLYRATDLKEGAVMGYSSAAQDFTTLRVSFQSERLEGMISSVVFLRGHLKHLIQGTSAALPSLPLLSGGRIVKAYSLVAETYNASIPVDQ
ncbi:hypothetical protein CL619_01555 [archaeon]|nr:hypothetical protein [archaeon]|tara:strand:+ start:1439 stop:2875 length:1437 start_codon:yes stop_codon:yes gene_type:complete